MEINGRTTIPAISTNTSGLVPQEFLVERLPADTSYCTYCTPETIFLSTFQPARAHAYTMNSFYILDPFFSRAASSTDKKS